MTRKASEGEVKKPELSQKLIKDIESEQAHIARLKKNIANVLSSQPKSSQVNPQNKDLLYRFQIEINRLLVSDVFESKLKKLTSFLGNDEPMNPPSQRIN